jgi:hypothetical protein
MKKRLLIVILIAISLVYYGAISDAVSAERNIPDESSVLPYTITVERNISKELSSPRYVVSGAEKLGHETAILTSYALIDYTQSVAMFYGGSGNFRELNPMLGSKPTRRNMALFGIIGVGLFYLIADTLNDPWKQIFVDSIIASEGMNIDDNRRVQQGWNTGGPPIRGRAFNGIPIIISVRL